jgi:hypothetical protein
MKQTVKVPLADIKAFKRNSSIIKNNSILPIYGFIKFDNGTITKNSKNEFVIQQSNFSGSFLVEEAVLFNYIEYAESSDIVFTIDDKRVVMTDGETRQGCATDDINLYPICEELPKEQYNFDDTIMKAIGAAAHYTRDDDNDLIISHVFIGNGAITASDRLIAYCKKVDGDIPKTAIHKSIAERLARMSAGQFSETERKCFFKVDNMTYGFSKTEATYVDLTRYFTLEKGERFIVNKTKISTFNDLALANSPLKYAWPEFSILNGKMRLSATDTNYSRDGEKEIDVVGGMTGTFKYDAALMNKILKSSPDEELTFHQSNALFYITGDSGFSALIMELKTQKS